MEEDSPLRDLDLSFISDPGLRSRVAESIAILDRTEQLLARIHRGMLVAEQRLVAQKRQVARVIPAQCVQAPLFSTLPTWIPPDDLSEEACLRRFEEAWDRAS